MPNTISDIRVREILDSRGNPTIEVTIHSLNEKATCSVPSGASRGTYEAIELRDGDPNRYNGKGVLRAINNINEVIAPALIGANLESQKNIDSILLELDGTNNKSHLGANAILAISIGTAKLAAKIKGLELHEYIREYYHIAPSPHQGSIKIFANMINGGAHAVKSTSVQEFQIVPMHDTVAENVELIRSFQDKLTTKLTEQASSALGTGDEGGYTISGYSTGQVLELMHNIKAEMQVGSRIAFSMDIAANELYSKGNYKIDGQELRPELYQEMITDIVGNYHVFAIEDPFEEQDFDSFKELRQKHPETMIIGDDLTVTNATRLKKAIETKSIDGLIVKPNQIGTLSETLEVITMAHQNDIRCIASHRSGETNDDFIIDIAWGTGCFGVKIGAIQRGERVAKYNRLLELSQK